MKATLKLNLAKNEYWQKIVGIYNGLLPRENRLTPAEFEMICWMCGEGLEKDFWRGPQRKKLQDYHDIAYVNVSKYKEKLQRKGWIEQDGSFNKSIYQFWQKARNGSLEFNLLIHDTTSGKTNESM